MKWWTCVVNGLGLQLNAKLPRWSVSLTASPNFLFVLRNAWNIVCLMYFSDSIFSEIYFSIFVCDSILAVNSVALFAAFRGNSAPWIRALGLKLTTPAFSSFHPCYLVQRWKRVSESWVMGQMGHHFWMGHMGHGSLPVTHWPMMMK